MAKKRLVLLLDGTWNGAATDTPTNIVRIRKGVERANRGEPLTTGDVNIEQRIYYDEGVGTGPGMDWILGGAFGIGLSENVRQAYRFLSQFHEAGDEIYIFGFSRGAFTARSLAGFIAASGLLSAANCDEENMAFAWKYYRTAIKKRLPAHRTRLAQLSGKDVKITFLGVFDTVGALGVPSWSGAAPGFGPRFHDTKVGSAIERACQAVALDEHRRSFVPALFAKPDHNKSSIEQVWFPGVHSDIGGGFPRPVARDRGRSLAVDDLSLRWMISRLPTYGLAVSLPDAPPRLLFPGFDLGAPHEPPDELARAHDYFGLFVISKLMPMYRLVANKDLKPARPSDSYRVQPPDESVKDAIHISALYMIVTYKDYRPLNLLAALNLCRSGEIDIVGFDGVKMGPEQVAQVMDLVDRSLATSLARA